MEKVYPFPTPHETEVPSDSARKILTVSQLTNSIKSLLENQIGEVWLRAEVSNLRIPSSGHAYFTLKDADSQISAVLFKGRRQGLRFEMADGMELICFGKISVYGPQGKYQIILEYAEPAGLGALQAAFEQLKEKLQKEGLFEIARKRALPFFPARIGLVTSRTGAVIRDILHVLARRNALVSVLLKAVKVQGEGAAEEIAQGIEELNRYHLEAGEGEGLDLIIVARGGGSLEDLWAFNEERVARAIFNSALPIISAVGHEIDYTIADFVADLRAPTPSAAAEVAVPVLDELMRMLAEMKYAIQTNCLQYLRERKVTLEHFQKRLVRPDRRLADLRLHVDDRQNRLVHLMQARLSHERQRYNGALGVFLRVSPQKTLRELLIGVNHRLVQLQHGFEKYFLQKENAFKNRLEAFVGLNPLKILGRGYSVVRDKASRALLKTVAQFRLGQKIEITLAEGTVGAQVIELAGAGREKPPATLPKLDPPHQGNLWPVK